MAISHPERKGVDGSSRLRGFFFPLCVPFFSQTKQQKKSNSLHITLTSTSQPILPCFLLSLLLQKCPVFSHFRFWTITRGWQNFTGAGQQVLVLTRASLLQSTSTAVWNLIRHIKLILNHRLTEAILPCMIKSPEHFCPLKSNECLLYLRHFLMPERASEFEMIRFLMDLIDQWTSRNKQNFLTS